MSDPGSVLQDPDLSSNKLGVGVMDGLEMPDERLPIAHTSSLRASFSSPAFMQRAIDDLEVNGFDRADISVIVGSEKTAPYDEEDARQARTLQASGAASVAALAAAGVTIATGGLAAIAVGAAVMAGAAAGGATHVLSTAANSAEQKDRDVSAAEGRLTLSVQVPTTEKRDKAQSILRAAGADDIAIV